MQDISSKKGFWKYNYTGVHLQNHGKEQYPTPTQKNIEVELQKETTKPTSDNKETGVLTWEDTFQPGETKTYQFSYSVKYPKDLILNL